MVTTFNKKDLTSFGSYLLSEERTNRIKSSYLEEDKVSLEERLREVYHADMENWLAQTGKTGYPEPKVLKVGMIVNYFPSKDQEYDKFARNNGAQVVPAIVTAIWSPECANLTVLPDAPDVPFKSEGYPDDYEPVPACISVTSVNKLPVGTHNDQTGMWDFK